MFPPARTELSRRRLIEWLEVDYSAVILTNGRKVSLAAEDEDYCGLAFAENLVRQECNRDPKAFISTLLLRAKSE